MTQPKAIIFDADGTLLDSFELIASAYKHVAEVHNLPAPEPSEIREQMGKPLPDIFKSFYPDYDISSLLDTNSKYIAANTMKSMAFEGIEDLLDSLQAKGYKLAILTSGGEKMIDVLRRHDLDRYFTSIVHHERVQNYKPHPEGFLLAAKECGVEPNEAIMVGDTRIDIETGKNASAVATIAVTHGFGLHEDLVRAKADYITDNLAEVNDIISYIETDKS